MSNDTSNSGSTLRTSPITQGTFSPEALAACGKTALVRMVGLGSMWTLSRGSQMNSTESNGSPRPEPALNP